jgi:hypothetical protein
MKFETIHLTQKNQVAQITRQINSLRKRGIKTLNVIPIEYEFRAESSSIVLSKVLLHIEKVSPELSNSENSYKELANLISSANV